MNPRLRTSERCRLEGPEKVLPLANLGNECSCLRLIRFNLDVRLLVNMLKAITTQLELRPSAMPGAPPISGQVTQVARCAYGHPSRLSRYSRPVWCRAAQPTQIEKSGRSGTSSSLGDVTQITMGTSSGALNGMCLVKFEVIEV